MRLDTMKLSCGVMELAGLAGKTPEGIGKFIATGAGGEYGITHEFWADDDSEPCECECKSCAKCEERVDRDATCAMIIFSDKATNSPGAFFAAWAQRKFRNITASPAEENPNTGNNIRVWTMTVNKAFLTWARKQ